MNKMIKNDYSIAFILSFAGIIAGGLAGELKTVYDLVAWPIVVFATKLYPAQQSPDFFKLLYASLCVLLYVHIYRGLKAAVIWGYRKQKGILTEEAVPMLAYTEEIASALQVIQTPNVTDDEIQNALDDLMRGIAISITDAFPNVHTKDVRYAFLVAQQDEVLMVRLGKQKSLKEEDAKVVDWVLTSFGDMIMLEPIPIGLVPGHDMQAVGLVRNEGHPFRFGFVILLRDPKSITSFSRNRFYARASSLPLIVYMDKLMSHVVKYSMKMKGGRV